MANILCKKCGTENSAEYNFCMGCGEALVKPEPKYQEPCSATAGSDNTYSAPASTPSTSASIGNMPIAAAVDFVGKNSSDYIPKFINFEAKRSTASWNWPVALWSFLMGMPFVWFFYRKMYKIGSVILAAYTLLYIVYSVCTTQFIGALSDFFGPLISEIMASETGELAYEVEQQLVSEFFAMGQNLFVPSMLTSIISIASLALCIYLPIAANGLYMKHMLKIFNTEAAKNPTGISPFELRTLGGTSTGAAVGVAVGFTVATGIIFMATVGTAFIDFFMVFVDAAMSMPY